MKSSVNKFLVIALLLGVSIVAYFCKYLLIYFLLDIIDQWTLYNLQSYLLIGFNFFDQLLLIFFPAIVGFSTLFLVGFNFWKIFKNVCISFGTVYLMVFVGYTVALMTWSHYDINPLIPEYTKNQPFNFYWTIFIIIGIFIPIFRTLIRKDRTVKSSNLDSFD
jgi:hypothetical protein